jgi:hypothetical protein
MMVAAEFGAFKQRWILTNADITTLKNSPNEIWKIPAGDGADESTQVGEFDPTELGNYLTSMEKLANDIARITRTPKHYFYAQGGDPSGEALIAMEAPLNHKAQSTIDKVKPVWAEVASFLLLLDGQTVEAGKITPVFARPETVQPRTQAEIRQIDVNAGIPLINCVRREGWTEEEIAALEEDIADAKAGAQGNPVTDADLSDVVNQLSDLFPELSADGSQPASSTNQPSRPPPAPARTPPSANGRPAAPPRR